MNINRMINEQASGILKTVSLETLRGVVAYWEDKTETLHIIYYFDQDPTEDEIEEASLTTTYILAALPIENVREEFLGLPIEIPLPESNFWVFRRQE
jgi:hypothetical protein